jgi:hypothetical protein
MQVNLIVRQHTMRIGQDDNYLTVERLDPEASFSAYRVEAVTRGSQSEFRCCHDAVVFDTSEKSSRLLADFQELKLHSIELPISEGGWIRVGRDAHGQITVHYRVAHWRLAAALEGQILVDGEFANRFCTELRLLLWGKPK